MFVIFGWQKTLKPVETLLNTRCYHCNNHAEWSIWKETEWITLFFIRVLPFYNKYHISCDICRDSTVLDSQLAKSTLNPKNRDIKLHDALIEKIEQHQFSGLTKTQINFRKTQIEMT